MENYKIIYYEIHNSRNIINNVVDINNNSYTKCYRVDSNNR